ncbi:hypothetical protein HID58_019073, partial [Brassica napus]
VDGTASFWVGSEFSHLDVIFLVVGLPSIVPPRFARVRLHGSLISFCLPFPLCSLISLQLSSLFASLVALPFSKFSSLGLDSVFFRVCFVGLESYFWSQAWVLISRWLADILLFSGCFSSSSDFLGISV